MYLLMSVHSTGRRTEKIEMKISRNFKLTKDLRIRKHAEIYQYFGIALSILIL